MNARLLAAGTTCSAFAHSAPAEHVDFTILLSFVFSPDPLSALSSAEPSFRPDPRDLPARTRAPLRTPRPREFSREAPVAIFRGNRYSALWRYLFPVFLCVRRFRNTRLLILDSILLSLTCSGTFARTCTFSFFTITIIPSKRTK